MNTEKTLISSEISSLEDFFFFLFFRLLDVSHTPSSTGWHYYLELQRWTT